jgi:hypothetical protein
MKNISTGFGLCVAAAAALAYPFVSSLAPSANAVGVSSVAPAVAAAALAQDPPEPTIVWYGVSGTFEYQHLYRAWSDGRVEARRINSPVGGGSSSWCNQGGHCLSPWFVVSDPAQGLTFDADLNFDQAVDGADLGMLLAKWGPAPRNPVPPSDCPLALINP